MMDRQVRWAAPMAGSLLLGLGACSTPSSAGPASAPSSSGVATSAAPTRSPSPSPPAPHATEFNPPGDIPDNQVFLDYRVPGSTVHVKVPEGWARSSANGTTTFTDHYNSIAVAVLPVATAPTTASATRRDVPALRRSVSHFAAARVRDIRRAHGHAVLVTYLLDSAPSEVTGKVVRDAAERYEFWSAGHEAVLTLTGPKGADNVDPWRLVSDSLRWR